MFKKVYDAHLGLKGIFSIGLDLFRLGFVKILVLTLGIMIVPNLLITFFTPVSYDDPMAYYFAANFLKFVLSLVLVSSVITMVKRLVDGDSQLSVTELVKVGFAKFLQVFRTYLVSFVLVILLLLCFVIPGLIFSVFWVFAIFATILSDKYGYSALKYSKSIVDGRWWKTLGYLFVIGLPFAILMLVLIVPVFVVLPTFWGNIISTTIIDVIGSVSYIFLTVFYLNFEANKVVKENHGN